MNSSKNPLPLSHVALFSIINDTGKVFRYKTPNFVSKTPKSPKF